MSTALRSYGTFLIDYMNATYAEDHLVPVEEKEIDGVWYHINRWADERFIYKRIAIMDQQQLSSLSYTEQVAKFRVEDFDEFFEENRLERVSLFGDYGLSGYDAESSKRMIVVGRKK
jgi:hypothetical protein